MAQGKFSDLLKSRGFSFYLVTLFLGAFNDNTYKFILMMLVVRGTLNVTADDGVDYLPIIGALFILPFILLSGYAAFVSDVLNKRTVLIAAKLWEILAMALAVVAFLVGSFYMMLGVLFLMAAQSAFFSPAKFGIIPEMWPDKDLSRANGLVEMATFTAIILGTAAGTLMAAVNREFLWVMGLVLVGISVIGSLFSLGITRVPTSGSHKPFRINPWSEIGLGLQRLYHWKPLWLTVLGISFFWFLGALTQFEVVLLGKETFQIKRELVEYFGLAFDKQTLATGLLTIALAFGIGIGSLVAGKISGDKVELGLPPLGSIGLGLFSILLALSTKAGSPTSYYLGLPLSYFFALPSLAMLGFSGGLFIVPLFAYLQQQAGKEERGRLLATCGFMGNIGILAASGVHWLMRNQLGCPPELIILTFGIVSIFGTIYVMKILPDFFIRLVLYLLTHSIYRIRIIGSPNVPLKGPVLLVGNHMTRIDGILVGASMQRFVSMMVDRTWYEKWWLNWFMKLMNCIPTSGRSRRDIVEALGSAREFLRQGHVVCIFAEGSISRTGNLLPFKRGFEKIVKNMDVPVIPVHLDQLWGSVFSFERGKFLWKWPRRIPYPVTVTFGKPLPKGVTAPEARLAIQELGGAAIRERRTPRDLLHLKFIESAKRLWRQPALLDSSGQTLTFGRTLISSRLLSGWVRRSCAKQDMIGLLLPASVGGALANLAVLLAGKIPVNLNFTVGKAAMQEAIDQCQIRTILTSRKFLAKGKIEEREGMIFLEELMTQFTTGQKMLTALSSYLLPTRLLQQRHNRERRKPDDLATVIFSSGSTGMPKGVMLSHANIMANTDDLAQVFWVTGKDCMLGALPLFHSFGFTATLWLPLLAGFRVVYHPNPLDAKTIGKLVARHHATILISTPTFFQAYLRKCAKEDFASLRLAMVGAEKLREKLALAFREKYEMELLEGYGCTEMGPVVSVNTPDIQSDSVHQVSSKAGSVGHPLPSVAAKIVDPETGETLPYNQEGLLLVKGPNCMLGYLNQPEQTAEVMRDGWYVTGDLGTLDNDGFISITDRLSRFSKIGGEMVPHLKIEDAINDFFGETACAVVALPDEQKGERLIVLYTRPELKPEELWAQLNKSELPKIWLPRRENIHYIESIPLLGSGKTDLKRVKALAKELDERE